MWVSICNAVRIGLVCELNSSYFHGLSRRGGPDVATVEGIKVAKGLDPIGSGLVDVALAPDLDQFTEHLLDHRRGVQARMFAVFRDPVKRAASLFHYLQRVSGKLLIAVEIYIGSSHLLRAQAYWEPTYDPALANMTIIEWVHSGKAENNWLTRVLCGDMDSPILTDEHLALAKEIINRKFVVGLSTDMAESWSRFRSHFGWVGSSNNKNSDACMKQMTEEGANTNKHGDIDEDSEEWRAISSINKIDLQLYQHIVELFNDERVRDKVWSIENDIDHELENVVNAVQERKLAEYPSTHEDRAHTIGLWYFEPLGPIRCSNDGKHPARYEINPVGHLFDSFEECCREYWPFAIVECRRESAFVLELSRPREFSSLEAAPRLYYPTLLSASSDQGVTPSPVIGGQTSPPSGGSIPAPPSSAPALAPGSSSAPVVSPSTNRKLQQTVGSCIADGLQPGSMDTGGLVYSSITECVSSFSLSSYHYICSNLRCASVQCLI